MATKELFNALYTTLVSNTNVTATFVAYTNRTGQTIPISYYRDISPGENEPYPYLISTLVSSPQEVVYGGVTRASLRVQFSVIGEQHDLTLDAMNVINVALDDQILTLATGQDYDSRREDAPTIRQIREGDKALGLNEQGIEMWMSTADYVFAIRSPSLNTSGCT